MRGPEIAIDREPDTDRVLTIPNLISLCRLAGIPVFVWLMLDEAQVAAAVCLAVIAGTDWIDGGLARRWHQVTTLGKILDPTIDRVLIVTAFVAAIASGAMALWLGAVLLAREALVSFGGVVMGLKGARVSVSWLGKVYSSGMMVALPLFILGSAEFSGAGVATALAWVFIVPSGVLSWVTAVQYWRSVRAKSEETIRSPVDQGK